MFNFFKKKEIKIDDILLYLIKHRPTLYRNKDAIQFSMDKLIVKVEDRSVLISEDIKYNIIVMDGDKILIEFDYIDLIDTFTQSLRYSKIIDLPINDPTFLIGKTIKDIEIIDTSKNLYKILFEDGYSFNIQYPLN